MNDEILRVYWHDDCMRHNGGDSVLEDEPPAYIVMPEPHVETAMRILNIKGILEAGPLKDRIDLRIGRHATDDEILTFHTPAYLEEIKAADANPEPVRIDGRLLLVQEGGYSPTSTAFSAQGMIEGVLGLTEGLLDDPIGNYPDRSEYGLAVLSEIRAEWERTIASAG